MKYPSRTLENKLREQGFAVRCLWETKGPKNTQIAFHSMLAVNGVAFYVQTFKDGDGWQVYLPSKGNYVIDTVKEVVTAIGDNDPIDTSGLTGL